MVFFGGGAEKKQRDYVTEGIWLLGQNFIFFERRNFVLEFIMNERDVLEAEIDTIFFTYSVSDNGTFLQIHIS